MLKYKNYYNFPDYPLCLEIDLIQKKYILSYGCGQTKFCVEGDANLSNNLLELDNIQYLLLDFGKPIMYFTGYEFIYTKNVFIIQKLIPDDKNNFIVNEIISDEIVLEVNVDDINFMNEFGYINGKWIHYHDIENINERINNYSNISDIIKLIHELIPVHHHYPNEWEKLKKIYRTIIIEKIE